MLRYLRLVFVLLIFTLGCSADVEPGESCGGDDECGDLSCFCAVEGQKPGTCSTSCSDDSDCSRHGDGFTCRDFGTAATCGTDLKICLRGG